MSHGMIPAVIKRQIKPDLNFMFLFRKTLVCGRQGENEKSPAEMCGAIVE
jgi:hypothetical protein